MMKKAETKPKTTRAKSAEPTTETTEVTAKAAPKAKTTTRRPRKTAAPKEIASTTQKVTFRITAAPGEPVYLAGTFNNWDPEGIPLTEKNGVYSVTLDLEPGEYEYKFIVNGFWTMDPDGTREWRANGLGTLNSVIKVG